MFIYSIRASTLKLIACVAACAITLITLLSIGSTGAVYASIDGKSIDYGGIRTNEDRVEFIKGFGIKVKEEPIAEESFNMPEDFDRVILGYNQIQKRQGLDLTKYRRKRVTHYAYEVTNYDGEGAVYVNLLVSKNRIIGADICSAADGGFVLALVDVDPDKLK